MEEAKEDIVTLVDEDGNEHEFAVVDIIEVDDKEYALLMPAESEGEGDEDSEDVLVLRFEDDSLVMIEDEAEFNRVVKYLEDLGEQVEG
ncbi:MAG TPA: DUF1292 domain-containing protein [Stenomitos sp.]